VFDHPNSAARARYAPPPQARKASDELLDPLEWTRRYGYLYPRDLFRAALVGAMGRLHAVVIDACEGEWETRNAAWRASVAQRFNQPRDERGRFAGNGATP
jgi:hypothetical protein